ncbi:MAG: hypothetical protein JWN69_2064 [Alphaproteobacteria bacterium]|nr:hypothetical protein [Alphaproteobacteria bacterium]
MIGKIIGAALGERIARRSGSGARGALIGALAPAVVRRLFGPLGIALAGGYAAKKYYDKRKTRAQRQP